MQHFKHKLNVCCMETAAQAPEQEGLSTVGSHVGTGTAAGRASRPVPRCHEAPRPEAGILHAETAWLTAVNMLSMHSTACDLRSTPPGLSIADVSAVLAAAIEVQDQ